MKKSLPFLVCLLLILFGKTFLSAQDVKWAIRVGGSGTEIGFNIAVDSSKRTYAAQQIISGTSVNFNGSCTITGGSNSYDVSFVRLDTVGACISSKYIITQNDNVMGLRLDSLNNIYIVGNRSGTNSLCTSQATSGQDLLLAKLSSTGTCTWGKKIGGSSGDYGYRLSLDRDGNIYITGSFAGTVSFDGISLVSGGSNDGFIAKFNNSGTIQWAKKFGSTGDDFGYGISNVVNGNFYVCGRVQNTGTFGTLSAVSKGGYDAFIAKVDASNGSFVWLRTAGVSGAANENGIQVVMDPSGNALYTVLVSGGAIFGTDTIPYRCEAVVMYNSDGDIQWTRPMGSAAGYIGPSVAIHDSTIYFAGALGATTYIGPFTATTAGGADILLAALDYSGKPLWVKTYGSTASDYAMEIACDQEGDLYVTGVFSGTVNFGGISRTSSGSNDVYYFKATPPLLITKVAEGKNMVCGTGAFDVAYRTGTIFDTTNVFTVELSDTAGNFSQPVPVGTLNATTSGTITATIPDTIPAGSSYRLRITSSNPATTGAEYATNFRLSPIPSTPTPPTPQTSCSDTTVLFVFDSILAGSGGHQIEWALSSLFDTTEIIESNGSINLLVESGAMDTLWMRSRDSITGCVSGIVWTTGRVNAVPDQPTTSELLTSLEDTVAIFSFDTVEAGSGGDKIEWSLISDYSSSTTETSPATLAIDVNSGGNKTIYIRTDNEITGCNSESIMFIVMNGVQYGNDSSTNAPPTFFSVKSQMEAYMEANPVEEPEEDGPENNYLKWKWFWEPRHNPQNGRLDAAAAALIAYGSNPGNYCDTSSAFPSNWQSMGPSDDAEHRGRVNQIWIEPGDSSHLIVGTTGGVWELNGNTWTCMTDNGGIPSTAISALAVNPTSGNQGDIRVGLGSASQSNDDHHQWTHGYGLGVAIRDKTSHEWSIDEGFRNHYYAMDSNWLPIVSSAVFKPGSQDFYVSAGRYIFRKLAGQSNYETVYTDFFPFAKIGQITFSKTDSSKALATATGPITKLLRSTEGGKSGSWVDISNHVFKGTDFNTTFGTYPDTNWGTWNNVGNGVNWKVVSVPISVNNMAARVVSTSQDSTATLVSEFPGGSMQPNSYWSISFDAAIPANVQLRIRLCQDTGQIYNTSYFPHEIAFDVVSSNRLLAKYGFSFTNPTNTFYRFIGIDAYLPGSTTPLIIDNITLRSLSSATYFYDIVKDHTTGNPTSGHEIAYIAVKDMNHVVTLVKYDLDNLSHPVIWSKPAIALRTDVKVQVPEYNHNRIYLAGSQDWVYKTDSSQLSSLSFNLTASSHIDIRSLELIDEYGNELYVGNDGGISKLSNGGSVIQNYNKSGFATNLTFGFSSSEAIKSRVLAGNVDNATLC
ncbi:MAG: PQQ-like beta-propeller repeat protein [Bacteroidetes bacterium]|nr:PQQ-like beta-propeller repeat protein [Bacteroidota bacterium]